MIADEKNRRLGRISRQAMAEELESRRVLHGDAGHGLIGEYFSDAELKQLKVTRVDPTINFDWGYGSPYAAAPVDQFSARWSGQLTVPKTEPYTFFVSADDGVRLSIDGDWVIDQWHRKGTQPEYAASVTLQAGREYDFKLEYFEAAGNASVKLKWSAPSLAKQVVPDEQFNPTLPTPPVDSQQQAVRIDVGGAGYIDTDGLRWEADRYFTGGTASTSPFSVASTDNDSLYVTRRWGDFDYDIPVANGSYALKLLFAEPIFNAVGKRKFNIFAEDQTLRSNFDPFAAGGAKKAMAQTFNVEVTDGNLDLSFRKMVDNSILSAIELTPTTPVEESPWHAVADAPINVFEAMSATVRGKLYVLGGFYNSAIQATKQAEAYDPAKDAWSRIADMPIAVTHAGVVADGDTIWMVGGLLGDYPDNPSTSDVWKYDTKTNIWTRGPSLPLARGSGGLVLLGRELHLIGGFNPDGETDATTHYVLNLDAARPAWRTAAPLPVARTHMGAAAVGGKIYIVGGVRGRDETAKNLSDVYRYDPATNAWSAVASLPKARSHFASSTVVTGDGRIVIIGGVYNGRVPLTNVTEYNPLTNRWTELDPIPEPRKAPVAQIIGDHLIVATGSPGDNFPQRDVWMRSI